MVNPCGYPIGSTTGVNYSNTLNPKYLLSVSVTNLATVIPGHDPDSVFGSYGEYRHNLWSLLGTLFRQVRDGLRSSLNSYSPNTSRRY